MSSASILSVFVAAVVIGVLAFITTAAFNDARRVMDHPKVRVPVRRPCGCSACTKETPSADTVHFEMWEAEVGA